MNVSRINFGAVNKALGALDVLALDPALAGERGPDNVNGWIDTMVKHIEKTCIGCGISFIAGRRDKVFHSQECKNDWHQSRLAALKAPSEIEAALEHALRLTRARTPESVEARRIVFALLSAEFAPIKSAPVPIQLAPIETAPAPIEAPTNESVREKLKRALSGENPPTQKAIATACKMDPGLLSHFKGGDRSLNSDSLAALDRELNSHERKVEPR